MRQWDTLSNRAHTLQKNTSELLLYAALAEVNLNMWSGGALIRLLLRIPFHPLSYCSQILCRVRVSSLSLSQHRCYFDLWWKVMHLCPVSSEKLVLLWRRRRICAFIQKFVTSCFVPFCMWNRDLFVYSLLFKPFERSYETECHTAQCEVAKLIKHNSLYQSNAFFF